MLRLAAQKSGRLSDRTLQLIGQCGIEFTPSLRGLACKATNFPLELLKVRDDDIPQYLESKVADLAIVGENVLIESGTQSPIVKRLGFSKCRLSLAIPRGSRISSLQDLDGKRIATSYPNILRGFLRSQGIDASIYTISGSVEITPTLGLADAIADLVSSGETLNQNNLIEFISIKEFEACLVRRIGDDLETNPTYVQLCGRITSVLSAKTLKYITLNSPKSSLSSLLEILPGLKSPSILPHGDGDWVSVHTVIEESNFWEMIESLKARGAEGILVMPVEKVIV
jgi:ATP phosphoribosyltransferase